MCSTNKAWAVLRTGIHLIIKPSKETFGKQVISGLLLWNEARNFGLQPEVPAAEQVSYIELFAIFLNILYFFLGSLRPLRQMPKCTITLRTRKPHIL